MEHIWTMLMHKILQNHLLCAFVQNLKIGAIYVLYPESFCDKNLAIRTAFAFCDSASKCIDGRCTPVKNGVLWWLELPPSAFVASTARKMTSPLFFCATFYVSGAVWYTDIFQHFPTFLSLCLSLSMYVSLSIYVFHTFAMIFMPFSTFANFLRHSMRLLKSKFVCLSVFLFFVFLSFCLSFFSWSLFIGGRPGIIWGLISSFRGLLGMDGVDGYHCSLVLKAPSVLIMQLLKVRSDACIIKMMVIHSNMVPSARSNVKMDLYRFWILMMRKNNTKSLMSGVFIKPARWER